MIGVYDFCGHYDWTFAWLEERGGHELLQQYWLEAISQDAQLHAADLIVPGGIPAMEQYWGHTLAEEGAGYTTSALDEDTFRLDMHDCPSRGFLIKNQIGQHSDYCDHCIGWIGPMMNQAGFGIHHEHNHLGQCWWKFRRQGAHGETPDCPPDQDITNSPEWMPGENPTAIDRFEPGEGFKLTGETEL